MADNPASSSWSELPWDLLDRILQHLELPESLAVASVCAPWRSAAAASGVPRAGTPWLVSQTRVHDEKTENEEAMDSEFRNLVGTSIKTYTVSLPHGRRRLAWRGASRGWLIATDGPSNIYGSNHLLYNPFTFVVVPLPPITDHGGVTAVYHDDGVTILGYRYPNHDEILLRPLKFNHRFYDKVALSCDPSRRGADCVAMAIYGIDQVSFARPGGSSWRLAPFAQMEGSDRYADCVYHDGRFYAVTMHGAVETWDLDTAQEPTRHKIVDAETAYRGTLLRFLVSTPWGGLLQIRALWRDGRTNVEVLEIDVEKRKLVKLSPGTAFREHAVFVGLNESACLHAKDFPEIRPNCVYFTTPWLTQEQDFHREDRSCVYHLETQTFEHVLIRPERSPSCPREVWFIPNI